MRIGELARLAGISTRMLRHYDRLGLVSPSHRTANGYRDYAPEDVTRLFQVEGLRSLGLPLREIGELLDDAGATPAALVAELISHSRRRIERERELLHRLHRVRDSGADSWQDVLGVVELLQELDSSSSSRRQRALLTEPDAAPAGALVEALGEEGEPNVVGTLQWALARTPHDAAAHLTDALASPDERTRHHAVAAIVKLPSAQAVPVLRSALGHTDPMVRARAAIALGTDGVSGATAELVAAVARGIEDVAAAEALGRLALADGDGVAGALVSAIAEEQAAPGARARLTQALAEVPGPRTREALTALADDEDPAVSYTARYLLAVGDAPH